MANHDCSAATHTRSRTVSKTINGSHSYMVDGFSLLEGMGFGNCISSDVFTVAGYDWALDFYPEGKTDNGSSHISVYLVLKSSYRGTQVTALFDISLLDPSGNGDHFTKTHAPYLFHSTDGFMADCGYTNFFERGKLVTSKYLKDDSLVLLCNINVVTTTKEPPREQSSICIPSANLGHCFKGILDNGMASDIVFKIGNKAFKAHKLILAARSQVFQAQFYGPLGNPKTDEVVIKDIYPPVFEVMLDFIYSDSLPNLDEYGWPSSTTLAQHLFAAADRYGLDRLKLFCEVKLCDNLTVEMVTNTLRLADQHNCYHLKSACLKFIASNNNLGVVMKSENFRKLEKSSPSLLSELLQTIAYETRSQTNVNETTSNVGTSCTCGGWD